MGNRQQELNCLQNSKKFISTNNSVYKYLKIAKSNPKASDFPDFIFDGGFIEHFQVTSAMETKKGDKHRIAESDFDKESERLLEELKTEYMNSEPCPGTLTTDVWEMDTPKYSYEYFSESFKRNFEKHIESLDKYQGEKYVGIFLVEYSGARIKIMKNGCFLKFYKIEYDKDMLLYLQDYSDKLKYVICFWGDTQGDVKGDMSCEIIELSRILDMVSKVPRDISFEIGRMRNIRISSFFDI